MLVRVVLAIKDRAVRARVAKLVEHPQVHLAMVDDLDTLAELGSGSYDVGIADDLPPPGRAEDLLEKIRRLPDRPALLLLTRETTGHDFDARCSTWLGAGIMAVLDPAVSDDVLRAALETFLARRRQDRIDRLATASRTRTLHTELVSRSKAMESLLETARRVAMADSPVLVLGETGVGKERLARLLHTTSPRSTGPFVAVNCAAIPGELFESELFGHQRGAFTGAIAARRGKFELAHRGTIFLDEVGEVPLHLQAKLLRVLEERRVTPVGSDDPIEVDARVIAASNRDLRGEMQAGHFRRDLFYRLGVVELTIPPLRDRAEAIPELAESYLRAFREQLGREIDGSSPEALEALCRYDWPGNVRELVNVIERAVLLCRGRQITLEDLPDSVAACTPTAPAPEDDPVLRATPGTVALGAPLLAHPWKAVREAIVREGERAYLDALLRENRGKIGATARRAGLSPRSLFEKMRKHGLRKEDYRDA